MAQTTPNMNLKTWDLLTDNFSHADLRANFLAVDQHDHTPGKGVQISAGGLANLAVTTGALADQAVTSTKIANLGVGTAQLNDLNVTTGKLADAGITYAKFGKDGTGPGVGAFHAYRSGAFSLPVNGTTEVVFDTETFDFSNWFNNANGRFTPQVKGVFRFSWALTTGLGAVTANNYIQSHLLKNGGLAASGQIVWQGASSGSTLVGSATQLANGSSDFFSVTMSSNNSSPAGVIGTNYTFFCGEFIAVQT